MWSSHSTTAKKLVRECSPAWSSKPRRVAVLYPRDPRNCGVVVPTSYEGTWPQGRLTLADAGGPEAAYHFSPSYGPAAQQDVLDYAVLRTYAIYAVAAGVGIFAPVFVLWAARTTPVGASPVVVAVAVVLALAFTSALLASFLPRHWVSTTSLVSLPTAVLGSVMFLAFAGKGATYYVWLFVGMGSLVSSAIAAFLSARVVLRLAESNREFESGR